MTHLKLEGHADVSHNELVLLQVNTKLDKGELDARGGVIAGTVLVQDIQAHGKDAIFIEMCGWGRSNEVIVLCNSNFL